MQRRPAMMLLRTAMMAMAISVAAMTNPLSAQESASASDQAVHLDVTVAYNTTLADIMTNDGLRTYSFLQGGSAQFHSRFYRGLGAAIDVSGGYTSNFNNNGLGLSLITVVVGPRYTWVLPRQTKYELYGQALGGEAFGINGYFPTSTGIVSNANSLALEVGGGMNIALRPHLALRAFQLNWLRTQLPNSATNVQNYAQVGVGVTYRFR